MDLYSGKMEVQAIVEKGVKVGKKGAKRQIEIKSWKIPCCRLLFLERGFSLTRSSWSSNPQLLDTWNRRVESFQEKPFILLLPSRFTSWCYITPLMKKAQCTKISKKTCSFCSFCAIKPKLSIFSFFFKV